MLFFIMEHRSRFLEKSAGKSSNKVTSKTQYFCSNNLLQRTGIKDNMSLSLYIIWERSYVYSMREKIVSQETENAQYTNIQNLKKCFQFRHISKKEYICAKIFDLFLKFIFSKKARKIWRNFPVLFWRQMIFMRFVQTQTFWRWNNILRFCHL